MHESGDFIPVQEAFDRARDVIPNSESRTGSAGLGGFGMTLIVASIP